MGNPVSYKDLFDFSSGENEVNKAIATIDKLDKTYNEFVDSVSTPAMSNFERQMEELSKSVKLVATETGKLNVVHEKSQQTLLENLNVITKLKAENDALRKAKEGARRSEEALAGSVNGLTQKLRAQIAEYKKLDVAQNPQQAKNLEFQIRKTRGELEKLNTVTKNTTKAANAVAGSYNALDRETKKLVADYKNLANATDKNNTVARQYESQIKRNTDQLKKMDAAMGQNFRNVGNYSSGFSNITSSLSGMAKGFLTITALQAGFSKIMDNAAAYESLNAAIKAVSGTQEAYLENMEFLNATADKYGQSLTLLATTYKGITAAARGTSLEGQKTKAIFEGIVQAGAAMKLTNEQVEGSLLAISQMISKGKVSSEELSQQLGERLPGAFKLFADAAGVGEGKLRKMMENGEVYATDILPKVAAKLKETYGADAIENANGLVNAQNRLTNSFERFLNAFTASTKIDKFWAAFKTGISGVLDSITIFAESPSWKSFSGMFGLISGNNIEAITRKVKEQSKAEFTAKDQTSQRADIDKSIAKYKELKALRDAIPVDAVAREDERNKLTKRLQGETAWINEMFKIHNKSKAAELESTKRHEKELKDIGETGTKDKQKKAKTDQQIAEEALREQEKLLRKQIELIKAAEKYQIGLAELKYAKSGQTNDDKRVFEKEKLSAVSNSLDNQIALFPKDSVDVKELQAAKLAAEADYYNAVRRLREDDEADRKRFLRDELDRLEALKKKQEEVAKNKAELQRGEDEITNLVTTGANRVSLAKGDISEKEYDTREHDRAAAIMRDQISAKEEVLAQLNEMDVDYFAHEKELQEARKALIEENFNFEIAKAEELEMRKQALQQAAFDFAIAAGDALFQINADRNEARIADLERAKDKEIELAGNNAAAKEKIEANFAKKVAEIKRKQAQYDKVQALFTIAVNTAIAVTSALSNVYTAAVMVPFVIAMGALQAAAVIAKPIPKYAKGRTGGPEEVAEVNEQGTEFIVDRSGRLRVVNGGRHAITKLEAGESVYTATETKRMINNMVVNHNERSYMNSLESGSKEVQKYEYYKNRDVMRELLADRITEQGLTNAFQSAISNIPVSVFTADQNGIRKFIKTVRTRTEQINERNNINGNG